MGENVVINSIDADVVVTKLEHLEKNYTTIDFVHGIKIWLKELRLQYNIPVTVVRCPECGTYGTEYTVGQKCPRCIRGTYQQQTLSATEYYNIHE